MWEAFPKVTLSLQNYLPKSAKILYSPFALAGGGGGGVRRGEEGYLTKFRTGSLRPKLRTLTLLYNTFDIFFLE